MGFCKPMSEEVPLINTKTISKEELDAQRENAAKVQAVLQSRYTDKPLACVITYGCQQNVADSEHIKGMLADMGYAFTDDRHKAQFILFNTCAVREHAEDRVFGNVGALKSYKAEHPDTVIALCGCMMQQQHIAERIKQSFPFVDLVFGTHVVHRLPELLLRTLTRKKRVFELPDMDGVIAEGVPVVRDDQRRAWLPIMYGCNNFCTYCIVPYVRGRERSRDMDSIYAEVKNLVDQGYKEITLLGQNVNSYGNDLTGGESFSALLDKISQIKGDYRLRFMSNHPKDLTEEMVKSMAANKNICHLVHLPIQSGSTKVLKEMHRRYTKEDIFAKVDLIKKYMPDCGITTDIMVGFPGETEEDFQETLDVVEKVRFSGAFTFVYSRRKGTVADKMENQISEETKKDRIMRLVDAQNAINREKSQKYVGKTVQILCEDYDKKRDCYLGRDEYGKMIYFKSETDMIGKFVMIKVNEASGISLYGTKAEE